ncbi:MAG TPA: V-type ATP synthase subunit D [bacterium]|nr:V-type ATP synthase subunit D [bacterium]
MAHRKIKLTRPELKAQREVLARYERYLPTLKLKQQQLQISVLEAAAKQQRAQTAVRECENEIAPYRPLLRAPAGIDLAELTTPAEVVTETTNVAGVGVPLFIEAVFDEPRYSLFATAPWVDRAVHDLRRLESRQAEALVLHEEVQILHRELRRVNQRLNLFEKVMIPRTKEAIRRIRIYLGDEQTAAVGRAKIAKAKQASKRTVECIPLARE